MCRSNGLSEFKNLTFYYSASIKPISIFKCQNMRLKYIILSDYQTVLNELKALGWV